MNCEKCGYPNDEDAVFCSGCGVLLNKEGKTELIDDRSNGETEVLFETPISTQNGLATPHSTFDQSTPINNMPQLRLKVEKKKSKLTVIIAVALILIIGAGAVGLFGVSALNTKKYDELIDTGEKYLEELKYEEAVETYLDAIDIKPKREEAYIGAATGYVKLNEPEKAKDTLEQGLAKVKEPSEKFTDLCDELGVDYEGSDTNSESESQVVQKQYTADDIEDLSKYLYWKGYDQIDWNNINQETAISIFFGASSYGGMQNMLVEGSAEYVKLTGIVNESIYLGSAYRLEDVNKNVRSLFGYSARLLTKNDFALLDGSEFITNDWEGPVFVRYYQDLDWIIVCNYGYGYEDLDLDYIIESIAQGDTILIKRRFFTIYYDDEEMINYKTPSGFNWGTASFSEMQEVAKNYYSAAKSAGINVDEYIREYTLAYNADGTVYLKSVRETRDTNIENSGVQTTDSLFGSSIATVYMVKTKEGGPINLRSGPGVDYAKLTTLPNSTIVNGQALSKDGFWVYVNVNGTFGWVSLEFLVAYS